MLVDLPAYPQWNPFLRRAEGRVEVGGTLVVLMQPVGGRAVTLRPTVIEAIDASRLRWRGRLGMSGIFDADHEFRIEALPGGRSRLTQDERSPACSSRSWHVPWTGTPAGLPRDERRSQGTR